MLNDVDLRLRYQVRADGQEDVAVEFKSYSNPREWAKICVAFANSLPLDFWGVLFIGIGPDGKPQPGLNLETIQIDLKNALDHTYPPVYAAPTVFRVSDAAILARISHQG